MIRPGFHDGALFLTPVESIKRREAEKVRGLPEAGSNSHNRAQQGRLTGGARQGAVPGQGRYRARPGRSREVQSYRRPGERSTASGSSPVTWQPMRSSCRCPAGWRCDSAGGTTSWPRSRYSPLPLRCAEWVGSKHCELCHRKRVRSCLVPDFSEAVSHLSRRRHEFAPL